MKPAQANVPRLRIAVLESDPLRFVGFRALFDNESNLEILASSIPELGSLGMVDLVLLGSHNGQNLFDTIAGLKARRPDLKIIVTGSGADDETILKALAAGARGYVDAAGTPTEFVQAIRMVNRRILRGKQSHGAGSSPSGPHGNPRKRSLVCWFFRVARLRPVQA